MRALVVLLLTAVLAAGCSAGPQDPGPQSPDEARGTRSVEPPPPAADEAEVLARVEAAVAAARASEPIPDATAPSVRDLKGDYAQGGGCPAFYGPERGWRLCARGDADGERTLVVIGDSHARQWGSPLDTSASRHGYAAYHLVRLGCPAADVTPWLNQGGGPNLTCADFHDWTTEQVQSLRPDVVVLAMSFNPRGYVGADGQQVLDVSERLTMLEDGVLSLVRRLAPYVGRFVVIGDPPAVALSPAKCLLRRNADLGTCSAPGAELPLRAIESVRRAAAEAGIDYVATGQWFCSEDLCPTVLGELLPYRDQNHVSDTYARYLTELIDAGVGLGSVR